MGIINRIKSIFNANVNASLDKMEDPVKMTDQYIREAEESLGVVKARVADAMVIAERAGKKVSSHKALIETTKTYATAALKAGNDEDVEVFIGEKVVLEEQLEAYETAKAVADANVIEARAIHDDLQKTLEEYKGKRDVIRSKADVLKIKEQTVSIASLSDRTTSVFGNFAKMEKRLDEQLLRMDAMAELDKSADALTGTKAKYDIRQKDDRIAKAIEAFKAEQGAGLVPVKA